MPSISIIGYLNEYHPFLCITRKKCFFYRFLFKFQHNDIFHPYCLSFDIDNFVWHLLNSFYIKLTCLWSLEVGIKSSSASGSSHCTNVGGQAPAYFVRLSGSDCESAAKGPALRMRWRWVRKQVSSLMVHDVLDLSVLISCLWWLTEFSTAVCRSSGWLPGGDSNAICLISRRGDVARLFAVVFSSRVLPILCSREIVYLGYWF